MIYLIASGTSLNSFLHLKPIWQNLGQDEFSGKSEVKFVGDARVSEAGQGMSAGFASFQDSVDTSGGPNMTPRQLNLALDHLGSLGPPSPLIAPATAGGSMLSTYNQDGSSSAVFWSKCIMVQKFVKDAFSLLKPGTSAMILVRAVLPAPSQATTKSKLLVRTPLPSLRTTVPV